VRPESRLDQREAFRVPPGDADAPSATSSAAPLRDGAAPAPDCDDRSAVRRVDERRAAVVVRRALLNAAAGWCTAENTHFRLLGSP
jgi:hypothetical protein